MKKQYFPFIILLSILSACSDNSDFDATGTFEATEIIVSAESNGKLFRLDAEEGTHLTQGEEVGLIDTVQLYLKKLQLEATMKSVDKQRPDIRKQIAATKEQLSTARRERTRVENLLKANAANRKQLDDWDSQIAVLQSQLEAQISSLTNSTQSLNEQSSSVAIQILQTEDQLNKCRTGRTCLNRQATFQNSGHRKYIPACICHFIPAGRGETWITGKSLCRLW